MSQYWKAGGGNSVTSSHLVNSTLEACGPLLEFMLSGGVFLSGISLTFSCMPRLVNLIMCSGVQRFLFWSLGIFS